MRHNQNSIKRNLSIIQGEICERKQLRWEEGKNHETAVSGQRARGERAFLAGLERVGLPGAPTGSLAESGQTNGPGESSGRGERPKGGRRRTSRACAEI